MAWRHYEQSCIFDYETEAVINAIMQAAAQIGLKLKNADRAANRAEFGTGVSLTTWGQTVEVGWEVLPDGKTRVNVKSTSGLGTELTSKAKNQDNVVKFVNALNFLLPQK